MNMRLLSTSQISRSNNEAECDTMTNDGVVYLCDSVDDDEDPLGLFTSITTVVAAEVVGTICWTSVVDKLASVVTDFVVNSSPESIAVVASTSLFCSVRASTCWRGDSESKTAINSEAISSKFLKFWRAMFVTKQLFCFDSKLGQVLRFMDCKTKQEKNSKSFDDVKSFLLVFEARNVTADGGIQFEVLKRHKNTVWVTRNTN